MEANIKFVSVALNSNQTTIASYQFDNSDKERVSGEMKEHLNDLKNSADIIDWPQVSQSNFGKWHFQCKDNLVCFVLTRSYYPDEAAKKFIEELRGKFQFQLIDENSKTDSYTSVMKKEVNALRTQYEDLKNVDRVYAANARVDEAKGIATESIHQVIRNSEHADRLEEKSLNMKNTANAFRQESKKVERHFCKQHWKMIGCISVIVLIIIIIIVAVVASKASD